MIVAQRCGIVAAVLLIVTMMSTASAAGAAPQEPDPSTGWIRVGHLSPATPEMDVYLAPFGEADELVRPKAGYGAVSQYSAVPSGVYTVSLRPAEAPADAPVVLSEVVEIERGIAYSLFVFETGPQAAPQVSTVADDLTVRGPEVARVRMVQGASAPGPVTVRTAEGQVLARELPYGQVSPYTEVGPGRAQLDVTADGTETRVTERIRPGSPTTLVVTSTDDGDLEVRPIPSTTAVDAVPRGSVATGGAPPVATGGAAVALVALTLVGAAALWLLLCGRRVGRHTVP